MTQWYKNYSKIQETMDDFNKSLDCIEVAKTLRQLKQDIEDLKNKDTNSKVVNQENKEKYINNTGESGQGLSFSKFRKKLFLSKNATEFPSL